jgi:hypothetical protein
MYLNEFFNRNYRVKIFELVNEFFIFILNKFFNILHVMQLNF